MLKISANYIFTPRSGFIKNGILKLDDDGSVIELFKPEGGLKEEAGLKFYNGIIVPGFVNAHCHIELSHLKGKVPEKIGMDNFIHHIVTGRDFDEESIRDSIEEADREMAREGIVAVGDVSNREDSFELKQKSSLNYHTFVEIFNMENAAAASTFTEGTRLLNDARDKYGLKASLTPHSAYTVSERLFDLFRLQMDTGENLLSVHNQETEFEDQFIYERDGRFVQLFETLGFEKGDSKARNMRTLPWLQKVLPPESPRLFIHNVFTTKEDIEESGVNTENTFFCLCPNSNLFISNLLPGTTLIDSFPENVCLGTDSLSSNHRLSILAEMITLEKNYPDTGLQKLLSFASLNGAKALKMEDHLGSFEKGKKPGVNLIENMDLEKLRLGENASVKKLI
jgi:cytosine/adenosine deaminase-related metal-dependent hydrolase